MNLENDAYFGENDSSLLNSSFANDISARMRPLVQLANLCETKAALPSVVQTQYHHIKP